MEHRPVGLWLARVLEGRSRGDFTDDTGVIRLPQLCMRNEIEERVGFRWTIHQRHSAKIAALSAHPGHVLKGGVVRDPVEMIDAKTESGQQCPPVTCRAARSYEGDRIFRRGTKPRLVSKIRLSVPPSTGTSMSHG